MRFSFNMIEHKDTVTYEQGNLLMYILIAVALLAALIYTVSESNRGSVSALDRERNEIVANEILDYGASIANAVAQIRLRGCAPEEISFERNGTQTNGNSPTDEICHVFSPAGGGVTYRTFEAFSNGTFLYTGGDNIPNVGGGDPDLWLRLRANTDNGIAKEICAIINEDIGANTLDDSGTTPFEPVIDGAWASTNFTGSFPAASDLSGAALTAVKANNFDQQSAWCAGHDTSQVSFYRLLMAR